MWESSGGRDQTLCLLQPLRAELRRRGRGHTAPQERTRNAHHHGTSGELRTPQSEPHGACIACGAPKRNASGLLTSPGGNSRAGLLALSDSTSICSELAIMSGFDCFSSSPFCSGSQGLGLFFTCACTCEGRSPADAKTTRHLGFACGSGRGHGAAGRIGPVSSLPHSRRPRPCC